MSGTKHLATWIFGALFVLFLIGYFIFGPAELSEPKQRVLAIISSLLVGLFGFFLTGSILLSTDLPEWMRKGAGNVGIRTGGGAALFVFTMLWWSSPLERHLFARLDSKAD